jgi:flagellar basal body-associated protein FliL
MKNQPSSNKKTLIIGIIIVVVLAGGWYFFSKGSSSPSTSQLISSTSNDANATVGASVLNVLNSVSSIKIDASFFNTPAYQSLVDYSITVPPQAVGRPNPFAPVGQ